MRGTTSATLPLAAQSEASASAPAAPATPAAPVAVPPRPTPDLLTHPVAAGLDRSVAPRAPRSSRSGAGSTGDAGTVPAGAPVPVPDPEPPAPAVSAAPGAASQLMSLLNGYRAANGLAALSGAGDAMAKAQAHAEEMAAAGSIWHSNLSSGISSWSSIAENVGMGGSATEVHNSFVASPGHRANMLGDFQDVGVGAAYGADGTLFVCEVFVAR